MNIPQLVAFITLMQSGEGILGVSPSYIIEKYEAMRKMHNPADLLDMHNRAIYEKWMDRWSFNKIGG